MATGARRKTSVRRKKTARRASTSRGRRGAGKRKLPNWSLLVLGLAIGLLSAWLIQLIIRGMHNPDSGLNNLIKSKPAAVKPAPKHAPSKPAAKPTYDFYTILPETETPITERDWARQKQAPTEKGVNYMLQAASYSSPEDADHLKARLILNGLSPSIEKVTIEGKGTFYRVRVGPYANTAEVDRARNTLASLGIKPMLLKIAASKN